MTREHYQDLLLDYVYGLLDQEQAGELRDHLSSCTACRTALRMPKASNICWPAPRA